MMTHSILRSVRLNRKLLAWVVAPLFVLLGTGCGGISASRSVSPATFLLPGLMQATPKAADPISPAALPEAPQTVAQAQ